MFHSTLLENVEWIFGLHGARHDEHISGFCVCMFLFIKSDVKSFGNGHITDTKTHTEYGCEEDEDRSGKQKRNDRLMYTMNSLQLILKNIIANDWDMWNESENQINNNKKMNQKKESAFRAR